MSSNYWQIKKQSELFKHGNTVTSRIESYIKTWERRCYLNGIPDEVPAGVAKSNRAPSYKSIAISILNNDFNLKCCGLSGKESKYYSILKAMKEKENSKQIDLL